MKRTIVNNKIHESHNNEKISSSKELAKVMQGIYSYNELTEQEAFYTIGLDSDNRIKLIELSTLGTVNCAYPIVREIVKTCLLYNIVSVIVCHNHPSGVLTPSRQDKEFTTRLKSACELMDIRFLDHIIISQVEYYSMCDKGAV